MEEIKPTLMVRLKFQKHSVLKFVSGLFSRPAVGFIPVIFIILFLFLISACFHSQIPKNESSGVYHLVKKNETIEGIAKAYGVSSQKLIRTNNINDVNSIKEGTAIFIPSAAKVIDNIASAGKIRKEDVRIRTEKNSPGTVKKHEVNKDAQDVKSSDLKAVNDQKKITDRNQQSLKTKYSMIAVHEEPADELVSKKESSHEESKTPLKSSSSHPEKQRDKITVHEETMETNIPKKKSSADPIARQSSTPVPGTEKQNIKITVHKEPAAAAVQNNKESDKTSPSGSEESVPQKKLPSGNNRFIWPVRGEVKSHFGVQPNKTFHNWIKIVSSDGVKVKTAEAGTVIFSSDLKNYGETIIIRHKNNFATVYTHLKKRYVKIDKTVKKGETIAVLGEKDDAGDVYMNFEIRLQGKARNPLLFLP